MEFRTNKKTGKAYPIGKKNGISSKAIKSKKPKTLRLSQFAKRKERKEFDKYEIPEAIIAKIWDNMDEDEKAEAYLYGLEDEIPDSKFPDDQRRNAENAANMSYEDIIEDDENDPDSQVSTYYARFGILESPEQYWKRYKDFMNDDANQERPDSASEFMEKVVKKMNNHDFEKGPLFVEMTVPDFNHQGQTRVTDLEFPNENYVKRYLERLQLNNTQDISNYVIVEKPFEGKRSSFPIKMVNEARKAGLEIDQYGQPIDNEKNRQILKKLQNNQ